MCNSMLSNRNFKHTATINQSDSIGDKSDKNGRMRGSMLTPR